MVQLLKDTLLFLVRRAEHPICRREMSGWSFIKPWRNLRRGCLPSIAVVFVAAIGASVCCCGGSAWSLVENSDETRFPLLLAGVVGGGILGVYLGGELLRWLTGLIATILSATAISAEIEGQTLALLRVTPVPPREIVLAKLGAVFQQIRLPTAIAIIARATFIVSAVTALITLIALSGPGTIVSSSDVGFTSPLHIPGSLLVNLIAAFSVLVVAVLWLLYYLLQPMLDMVLFAAVGLFASSLAKTRSNGLLTAIGLRLVLGMISYVISQIISNGISLLGFPLLTIPSLTPGIEDLVATQPGLLVIWGALLGSFLWLILTVLYLSATLVLLGLTVRRVEQLPYGL